MRNARFRVRGLDSIELDPETRNPHPHSAIQNHLPAVQIQPGAALTRGMLLYDERGW